MPRYTVTVECAIEADTPEGAATAVEDQLAGLDRGLTAREHGEAPGRGGCVVRAVRATDETAERANEGTGTADGAGG